MTAAASPRSSPPTWWAAPGGDHEAGNAKALRNRRVSAPIAYGFGGLVKKTDDGFLFEFPSVQAARGCALPDKYGAFDRVGAWHNLPREPNLR